MSPSEEDEFLWLQSAISEHRLWMLDSFGAKDRWKLCLSRWDKILDSYGFYK